MLGIWNCGIISSFRTIYGTESVSQTCNLLLDVIDIIPNKFPNFLAFDTACQLKQYTLNQVKRYEKEGMISERLNKLNSVKMVVDKFHFPGHVGKFCKSHCDPTKEKELDNINTEVCEQTNHWLSCYKHILNNMNVERFTFYLYCILEDHNYALLNFKHLFENHS